MLAILVIAFGFMKKPFVLHDFDKQSSLSLKGILAICVLVRHLLGKCYMVPDMIPLGYYSVILFFFCAGYGLMLQIRLKGDEYIRSFFSARWSKVFLPFCIASMAFYAVNNYVLVPLGGGNIECVSFSSILRGGTVLPNAWFAVAILLYYIAFYLCAIICRRKEWRLVLLLLAFTLLYLYAIGIKLAWGAYWINAVLAINVGTAYCLIETKLKKAIVFNRSLFSLMVPIA